LLGGFPRNHISETGCYGLNCPFLVRAARGIKRRYRRFAFEIENQLIGAACLITLPGEIFSKEKASIISFQITVVAAICVVNQGDAAREQDEP
jgi:hypothetical protein